MNFSRLTYLCVALFPCMANSQTLASTPFTPSWQVRHHLQVLVDHGGLQLPLTQWPLPSAAVSEALDRLPTNLPSFDIDLESARQAVVQELRQRQSAGLALTLRNRAEGLPGYGDDYTPGSSVQVLSPEKRLEAGDLSFSARLGARLEDTSNSLASDVSGMGTDGRYQTRLDGSSIVMAWQGWNLQAFSHRHWWGPGWQSSLVNGHNIPAWNGVGVQRASALPSESPWLRWMGPWNLDVFVARAQDPLVVSAQPQGYLFSGARLTLQPWPWLEVGLSRGMQTDGAGRPSGLKNFLKSFVGLEVNQNPGDPPDSSSQIAGYDLRVRCPLSWGACAAYTQAMGEDAAGNALPVPTKFMGLWGLERSYGQGRYRVFAEYTDTNAYSMPWNTKPQFPGYQNGVYTQGYTHGGRWIGSAQGGGSRVTTLGWMDAQRQRVVKLHSGDIHWSMGAGYPGVQAPHGKLVGIFASQAFHWQGQAWVPELSWTKLQNGPDSSVNQRNNLRLGVVLRISL